MKKRLTTACLLSIICFSTNGSAKEINLLCRYVGKNTDAIAFNLSLSDSTATSVTLVGKYKGAVSTYGITKTSSKYILNETNPGDDTTSTWNLDRQSLIATWRLRIAGRAAMEKETMCKLFEVENKI